MRSTKMYLSVGGLVAVLALGGCGAFGADWKALYSAKLGQPIEKMNTVVLNTPFTDEKGNLTRVGWAQLASGEQVFLGLPAHGLPADQVVERTVVLTADEVNQRCREAFPNEDVGGSSWTIPDRQVSNRLVVEIVFNEPAGEGMSAAPDPSIGYCEFVFVPNGWEFRVVRSDGIIKTNIPGVPTN